MVRSAFTMIELIFALVIMGIVFLTLPLILIQNADSVEDNIIQESIFLSSSKMSQLLTFQWDENSKETGIILSAADVLTVSATGDNELDRNISDFRRGHFREDKHRRMTPINNERNASAIGIEGALFDDIDDFDGIVANRSEEHTSELQSRGLISYAVFCLKKKKKNRKQKKKKTKEQSPADTVRAKVEAVRIEK